ncbi:retroviral-like aspartic protease family protein [Sphaerospermopsis aphanizomenoides BCCUSP55]|uniref:retropepsin-like aspartic protease family protein n=1 Tax=Sphaerospermopsis aphanizomenoides TaxID=459663 RepID=UPI001903C6DF|nr:retropepsin-like aspartic protease [Sphaerospermopsis aphanizomenoides]MBK1988098.1 retroviral-like aspartic protease family protein [Sphaerospermopsis aphanizomenoides BCCUSP55]
MQPIQCRWIGIFSGLMVLTVPLVAKANDPGLCYMKTSSGRIISLGEMCKVPPQTENVFLVPIKRRQAKTPIIDVKFNGGQVFEMVFDTGASGILITQKMATSLKVKPVGTTKASIADGSVVEFPTGTIASVAVGGVVVNNAPVTIAPKAGIGLLGHGFFENYDIKILEKQIEFHKRK